VTAPVYLAPYAKAVARYGGAFESLLWASPHTQALRFDALTQAVDLNDRAVVDAGCGRADLLDYLLQRNIRPRSYVGVEAVDALADEAAAKSDRGAVLRREDFLTEPQRAFADADVVVFSGSLNTLAPAQFYQSLQAAFDVARECVAFNYLCSSNLAGRDYLTWHRPTDLESFALRLARRVNVWDGYLDGDCTVVLWKRA